MCPADANVYAVVRVRPIGWRCVTITKSNGAKLTTHVGGFQADRFTTGSDSPDPLGIAYRQ